MTITIYLAQIWGPILLAVGLGFFISRKYYVKLYKDIQNEPLAMVAFGVLSMVIGITQIGVHNVWGSFAEGLMSFLGWATLVKGVIMLVVPGFVDKAADWEVAKKLVPIAGGIVLLAGIYLGYVGYFA